MRGRQDGAGEGCLSLWGRRPDIQRSPAAPEKSGLQAKAAAGDGKVGFVKIVAALYLLVVLFALAG